MPKLNFKLTILTFHRIIPEGDDYFIPPMAIREKTLSWLLEYLHFLGPVLKLSDAIERIKQHKLQGNCFSITFDDGYLDNFTIGKKILLQKEIPATFFIPINQVNNKEPFWWDYIRFVAKNNQDGFQKWACGMLPEKNIKEVSLQNNNSSLFARMVVQILNGMNNPSRISFLQALEAEYGPYTGKNILMDWDQIRDLASHGFEIGSHTLSHTPLTDLSDERAVFEIKESKNFLEKKIAKCVYGFCYPRGRYSENLFEYVKRSGYSYAVTTNFGSNYTHKNQYDLYRRNISNYMDFRKFIPGLCHLVELTGLFDEILLKRRIA